MKKLFCITFILFSACLFIACSDDDDNNKGNITTFDNWNNPKSPNYKPEGYNPIAGEWLTYGKGSKLIFTNDFKYQTSLFEFEEWTEPYFRGNYIINDKAFKLDIAYEYPHGWTDTHNYSISLDGQELTIEYPGGGTVTYYRLEQE